MRVSIRVRTILVMNLLVLAVAVVLGRLAGEVAGEVVEERLASELVRNTSNFLQARRLPFSDSLMRDLSRMFGVQVATFRSRDGGVVGSSLPPEATQELRRQIAGSQSPASVTLEGVAYRVDSHELTPADQATSPPERFRLCLVVPQKQFQDARDRAMERMTVLAIPAVAVATLLAVLLSVTITRPIRKLAAQTDELSARAAVELPQAEKNPLEGATQTSLISLKRGPSEVVRLAESFDNLLRSLRKVQGQLAQSERLATLGRLAASVAHELRNPLSGIKMNVRVLRDQVGGEGVPSGMGVPPMSTTAVPAVSPTGVSPVIPSDQATAQGRDGPETHGQDARATHGQAQRAPVGDAHATSDALDESFRLILREIDRMDLYLQELLGLAGNPSAAFRAPGSAAAVRESVSLADLAESVLSLLEGRLRHAGVEVRRDFADVPAVRADGNQLRQVILNLVINAIEAMPAGGVVQLGLASSAGQVRFSVTDSGGGVHLPPGADPFEPFVTTKLSSAGLGLHLCKQILSDHGGKIGYKSSETGAEFWFELAAG